MAQGLILHSIAKFAFIVVAYIIQIYLGKTLSAAEFGVIGVLISINNVNYNFLSQGARQAASKALAEKKYNEKDIIHKSIQIQFVVTIALFLINYVFADFYSSILNVPSISEYIRLLAFVVPAIAGYFLCLGMVNGFQLFIIEAWLMIVYSISLLSIIPYVKIVFADSAVGTIMGFLTAAVTAFIFCIVIIYRQFKRADNVKPLIPYKVFLSYASNFLAFFTCIAIILSLDMFFINAMLDNRALVGYYTGATNFAKIPYYLLTAIYLVALPVITQKYSAKDFSGCNQVINQFFEIIFLFILPISCIAAPFSGNIMAGFYRPEYRLAALPTAMLMFSQFFIGLMVVLNIFLYATNAKKFGTIVVTCVLALDALLCFTLIPRFSITGAATATLISGLLGCVITMIKVRKVFPGIWNKKLTSLIFSSLIYALVLMFLSKYLVTDNLISSILLCAIAYIIFILIVWGTRIASPIELIRNLMKLDAK